MIIIDNNDNNDNNDNSNDNNNSNDSDVPRTRSEWTRKLKQMYCQRQKKVALISNQK